MYFTYKELNHLYYCLGLEISSYTVSDRNNRNNEYKELTNLHKKLQTIYIKLKENKCKIEVLQKDSYVPTIYDKLKYNKIDFHYSKDFDDFLNVVNDSIKDLDL